MKTTLLPYGLFACMQYFLYQFKERIRKRCIITLLLIGVVINGTSQFIPSSDWSLYQELSGVEFHAKLSECPRNAGYDRSNVLIKIENTTDFSFSLEYHVDLFLSGKCTTCNDSDNENLSHFTLKPKQSIQGGCDMVKAGLSLFADWLEPGIERLKFSGFELSQLQVNREVTEDPSKENPFYSMEIAQLKLTIVTLRDEIISLDNKSTSSEVSSRNGWYVVTHDKLILALETLIKKDAIGHLADANEKLFPIEEDEIINLSPSALKYLEEHPSRYLIKYATK